MGIHWQDLIVTAALMAAGAILMITLLWEGGDDDE